MLGLQNHCMGYYAAACVLFALCSVYGARAAQLHEVMDSPSGSPARNADALDVDPAVSFDGAVAASTFFGLGGLMFLLGGFMKSRDGKH